MISYKTILITLLIFGFLGLFFIKPMLIGTIIFVLFIGIFIVFIGFAFYFSLFCNYDKDMEDGVKLTTKQFNKLYSLNPEKWKIDYYTEFFTDSPHLLISYKGNKIKIPRLLYRHMILKIERNKKNQSKVVNKKEKEDKKAKNKENTIRVLDELIKDIEEVKAQAEQEINTANNMMEEVKNNIKQTRKNKPYDFGVSIK